MPALFINVRIDSKEKFDFFKVTFSDVASLFNESHIKFRGRFASECVSYAKLILKGEVHFYQDLQETDWVAASLVMIQKIKNRSLFVYFEDHKLLAEPAKLKQILADFDSFELDYLCYSFFRASQLEASNLLPLAPSKEEFFHCFGLTSEKLPLLGKISPNYYTFSLASIASLRYFQNILTVENKPRKFFHRKLTSLFLRLFPYPGNKAATQKLNLFLAYLGMRLGVYPPATPFNLEKIWFETPEPPAGGWKMGIPSIELMANYDDDNGAYKESLIKRGLYPFDIFPNKEFERKQGISAETIVMLTPEQTYDCTYFSCHGRISFSPTVTITVENGTVQVSYQNQTFPLSAGQSQKFYSNLGPVVKCMDSSKLKIQIEDEAF